MKALVDSRYIWDENRDESTPRRNDGGSRYRRWDCENSHMTAVKKLKEVILKFGLKPATSRGMPLFSFTCVTLGYTKLLRERLGFSYEATAAFGEDGKFHSLYNEYYVKLQTGKFLKKHGKFFDKIVLAPVLEAFGELEKEFLKSARQRDGRKKLKIIHDIYPRYMSQIGVYNCLWRYIGNNENIGGLTPADIKNISTERDSIARFYPKVEEEFKKCVGMIGKVEGFDGDLLRYLTHSEMGRYLNGELTFGGMANELSRRREQYFYLYVEKENREEVITDRKIIEKVRAEFYHVPKNIKIIKGFSAYKGVARGRVYNRQNFHSKTNIPAGDFVLVASSTHPNDVSLLKKCVAIITDEGGILSHAAVIARELGKPCIIGTKIATKIFKDGDIVEVDANRGIVRKVG